MMMMMIFSRDSNLPSKYYICPQTVQRSLTRIFKAVPLLCMCTSGLSPTIRYFKCIRRSNWVQF